MRRMGTGSEATLEGWLVRLLWTVAFLAALAAFSITFLTHSNTFAIAEPLIRWIAPDASPGELAALHIMGRKLGHFLIPAIGYLILAMGPLRRRRFTALGLCAVFAILDESVQAFTPARSASIYDVALDISGALFGFFLHSAFSILRSRIRRTRTGGSKAQARTSVSG
jgi:VanZ family protein